MGIYSLAYQATIVIVTGFIAIKSVESARQKEWDHFMLAQQWPPSVCVESQATHKHKCEIPSKVSTWTVHGLWPSFGSSTGPDYCNSTKFDPDQLSGIMDKLETYWPNLFTDSPVMDFWKHEWTKHGTCALSLDTVNTELKYFSKGIDLSRTYDLLSMLEQANIKPSTSDVYQVADFRQALNQKLGHEPQLSCVYDKTTKTQYVVEVRFCLDKSFNVIACPGHENSPTDNSSGQQNHVVSMKQQLQNREAELCDDTHDTAYPIIRQ